MFKFPKGASMTEKIALIKNVLSLPLVWRQNIRHNDTQHNDIQHSDTQHKGFFCDTQDNTISCAILRSVVLLGVTFHLLFMPNVVMLGAAMLGVCILSVVMLNVVASSF
jgi:hypothetical protein